MKAVLPYLLCATTALAGCSHIANNFPDGSYFISGRATSITGNYVRPCEEILILKASTKLAGEIDALTQASQSSLVNDVYMNDLKRDPDFGRLSKSVDCDAQGKFTLGGVRNSFNNWSSLSWISCPRVFTSFIGAVPSMFEKDS